MIYLEYEEHVPLMEPRSHGVELPVGTIHEAAQLFLAFQAGCDFIGHNGKHILTSIGTSKKRGVEYKRWSGL